MITIEQLKTEKMAIEENLENFRNHAVQQIAAYEGALMLINKLIESEEKTEEGEQIK